MIASQKHVNNSGVLQSYISMLCIFVFVIHLTLYILNNTSEYLWILPVILNLLVLLFYRNQLPVAIMLAFFIPYIYVPKYFFVDDLYISVWPAFQTALDINFIALLNSIFLLSLLFGIGNISRLHIFENTLIGVIKDKAIFYIVLLLVILIIFLGLNGENVFTSGSYGAGTVFKSPLYEYAIALFLFLVLTLDVKSKLQVLLLIIIVSIYLIKSLLFGGRIEVVQLGLLYLYLFVNFFKGSTLKQKLMIIGGGSLAFLFMNVIGKIRTNPSLIYSLDELFLISDLASNRNFISNQFGDVYQSSLRVVGLFHEGYISISNTIISFVSVFFGSFFPSSALPVVYNLSTYRQDVHSSGGGGLISSYSFIWLSYLGPIFFGLYIGRAIRGLYLSDRLVVRVYGLLVLITFPRWFAYYPVVLFKMCLIGTVLVFLYLKFKKHFSTGGR